MGCCGCNGRVVAVVAGVFTLIEACIWIALPVVAILYFSCQLKPDNALGPASLFYVIYLYSPECSFSLEGVKLPSTVQDPSQKTFDIALAYVVLNSLWALSSLFMIGFACRSKGKVSGVICYPWLLLVGANLALDLVSGVMYGLDIPKTANFQDLESFSGIHTVTINTPPGLSSIPSIVLLLLSLRCIVFWIINAAFFICVIFAAQEFNKERAAWKAQPIHSLYRKPQPDKEHERNLDYYNSVHIDPRSQNQEFHRQVNRQQSDYRKHHQDVTHLRNGNPYIVEHNGNPSSSTHYHGNPSSPTHFDGNPTSPIHYHGNPTNNGEYSKQPNDEISRQYDPSYRPPVPQKPKKKKSFGSLGLLRKKPETYREAFHVQQIPLKDPDLHTPKVGRPAKRFRPPSGLSTILRRIVTSRQTELEREFEKPGDPYEREQPKTPAYYKENRMGDRRVVPGPRWSNNEHPDLIRSQLPWSYFQEPEVIEELRRKPPPERKDSMPPLPAPDYTLPHKKRNWDGNNTPSSKGYDHREEDYDYNSPRMRY